MFVFTFSLIGHATAQLPCSARLGHLVPVAIDQVSESRPRDSSQLRQYLTAKEEQITLRIQTACPDFATCPLETLSKVALDAVTEEARSFNGVKRGWKSHSILAVSLVSYVALNVWVTSHTDSLAAASGSALLTILGALVITNSGAASLEIFLAKVRKLSYLFAGQQPPPEPGHALLRHGRIYHQTQRSYDTTEAEGRDTDRHAIMQITGTLSSLSALANEGQENFLHRASLVMAKLLSDLLPKYPDLELFEPDYANWARVLFTQFNLTEESRPAFRAEVMRHISQIFDITAQPGTARRDNYENVLRAWTTPLPIATSQPDSH